MARTTMQRRVLQSEIKIAGIQLEEGGVHSEQLESIFVTGSVTPRKAHSIAFDKYKGQYTQVVVIDVEENEKLYEMEIDTFLEHATVIEQN